MRQPLLLVLALSSAATAQAPAEHDLALELRLADLEARLKEMEADDRKLPDAGEARAEENPLRLYGFTSFGYFYSKGEATSALSSAHRPPGFVFSSVNLYLDADLADHWRSLVELRFAMGPNGSMIGGALADTQFRDTTTGLAARAGSVILERAHVDYTPLDAFRVRVGVFLTPFGVWHEDHGAPILLTARPPVQFVLDVFPRQQLGMMFHGAIPVRHCALEYQLYVSNGRSRVDTQFDLDSDKAWGGRLRFGMEGRPAWWMGASAYRGRLVEAQLEFRPNPVHFKSVESAAAEERAVGADLGLAVGPFEVYAEAVYGVREFEAGKRPPSMFGEGTQPDMRSAGAFVLGAWRVPTERTNLRIIGGVEVEDASNFDTAVPRLTLVVPQGGLNWKPTPRVVVKAVYAEVVDITDDPHPQAFMGDWRFIDLQLALVF